MTTSVDETTTHVVVTEPHQARPCTATSRRGKEYKPCGNEAVNSALSTCDCGHLIASENCLRHLTVLLSGDMGCTPCWRGSCRRCYRRVVSVDTLSTSDGAA